MSFRSEANNTDGVPSAETTIHRIINDIQSQLGRLPEDIDTVKTLASTLLTDGVTDDRK